MAKARKIDWRKPIETLDGKPCEVVELDLNDAKHPAQVHFPEYGLSMWLLADGTYKGILRTYAVRNVVTAA